MAVKSTLPIERSLKIAAALRKAKKKHPTFTDVLLLKHVKDVRCKLDDIRWQNDRTSLVDAFSILEEEVLEVQEAYLTGNIEQAKDEVYDCIAVLMRVLDELDKVR